VTTSTTESFAQRFAANAEAQLKSGSTWLALALVPIFVAIANLPDLKGAIDHIPLLAGYGAPIAALLGILAAKFRPSGTQTTQTQQLVAELARLKMNEYLRAHGAPEIPAPATPVALPGLALPIPAAPAAAAPPPSAPALVPAASPPPAPIAPPAPVLQAAPQPSAAPPPPADKVDPKFEQFRAFAMLAKPNATDEEIVAAYMAMRGLFIDINLDWPK
jgi:hypothetical protein